MEIERHLGKILRQEHFMEPQPRMAFIVGPRRCGKTSLARALQNWRRSPELYRNWDDLGWRREQAASPYGFLDAFRPASRVRPLAVLDEIHQYPRWKRYLKGLWDTRGDRCDVIVTGSGRLDVFQRGGDSLLGRYHQYRLHPFNLSELHGTRFDPEKETPDVILHRLLKREEPVTRREHEIFHLLERFGGFPEPYLAQSDRRHRLWIRERRQRLIREDLRDLTRIQMLSSVEQMVELLVPRAGSLLSLNNLRQDLGVSMEAIKLWMESLERLYFCFRVRPFAGKLARTLRKEPKLYFTDWSEISDPGARYENMAAAALLRWCHFAEDFGQEPLELRFVRDKEKREVDFLLLKSGKPFLLIEVKASDTAPAAPLLHYQRQFGGIPAIQLVAHLDRPGRAGKTPILPLAALMAGIP